MPLPTPEFIYHRQVHFHETDPAGVAHFASLLMMVEEAEHAWLRAAGVPLLEQTEAGQLGWPRVRVEADFVRPLPYGQAVQIALQIHKTGRSSVSWTWQIKDQGQVLAKGSQVTAYACLPAPAGTDAQAGPVPLPIDFLDRMCSAL